MCGRALSGVGAAFVLPATLAVTLARLKPFDRPRAVALWSSLTGIGGVVGNIGGGLAVEFGTWRVLFWAGVPIALAAAALIAFKTPRQVRSQDPVDGGGAFLMTAGSVALLYGIIEGPQFGWISWLVVGSMLLAILLLSIFLWYEARLTYPILDPRLFLRAGVRAGALGIIALFFALFGLFYINAQYLQDIKGYSPLLSGICILPVAIVMPYVSAQSTKLAARFGARSTIIIGLLTLAAAMMLLSFSTAATPYPLYGLLLALVGVGMGLAMPPLSGTIVHALPPDKAGVSSGLNSTTREFGSALGVAVLSTVLTVRFADYLPAALQNVPGAQGEAIKHSITSALQYAASYPNAVVREQLLRGTRDAFTSATSIGLRVGVVLLLLTTVVIALQHPKE
jgi:MFS family permease